MRRWTREITEQIPAAHQDEEALLIEDNEGDTGISVANALGDATEMVTVPGVAVATAASDADQQTPQSPMQGGLLSPTNMLVTAARVLSAGSERQIPQFKRRPLAAMLVVMRYQRRRQGKGMLKIWHDRIYLVFPYLNWWIGRS